MTEDWTRTTLGDAADLLPGFAFKSALFTDEPGDVRLLRGDNIAQGNLRWNNARRWPQDDIAQHERYLLAPGDVVLAMDRPWIEAGLKRAAVTISDLPCLLVQRVMRLRETEHIAAGFLSGVVASPAFSAYIQRVTTGTAVPHISGGQIASFALSLPPAEEQLRIAAILGALDDKIAAEHQVRDHLARVRRESFRHETRESERVPLTNVADVVKGSVQPSETPGEPFQQFSIPAYDAGLTAELSLGATMASGKTLLPNEPVVLYSKLNPRTPRVWRPVSVYAGTAVCSPEFVVLRPKDGVPLVWLDSCLRHDRAFQQSVESAATGTTGSRQRIKPADLLAIQVPAFTGEHGDWAAAYGRLLDAEDAAVAPAHHLSQIRDLLLPKLISGAIRVPATTDEAEAMETVVDAVENEVPAAP